MSAFGERRVVITGSGTVSALGNDWAAVGERLRAMRSAVRYMPEWEVYPELKARIAAPIDDFQLPGHYRARERRALGRVAQMAVVATEDALQQAGLGGDPVITGGRTGVAYGSATGSSAAGMEFLSLLRDHSMEQVNTTTYTRMMSHTAAVNIGVKFGTRGRVYTTSSACTAGSQGVGYAYEAIKAGVQDVMIAGGAEELCPTQSAVFDVILAASRHHNDSPECSPRPFDRDRDGLALGEGATTLILEELEHARARGATVLAEVIGYATNADGAHLVRPQQATQETVIRLCLEDAGIDPREVGYVSAHATATANGDIAESHATANVLGAVPVSALKSYTGHSLGACAAFELWASIMMMNEGWFAPTLNLDNVDPQCAELDYIRGECRAIETDVIMSNNFAFGGINTSLLVRRWS
ncbi:beta-ketoacyl-ACP synthase [Mangrovimicrobium sediminis]|uniref:Beta-ketoacyl-ACP synthase n=1 Tax=Mangrovimicrobium sediminis TaxID=2562682 RepID=A0A4Z0LZH3_9GAMM|nr:beta-ketoacyl-ACP synthase [Haliea sp. SAOS-164]TGD72669.1 beta-ketoacyl-ACP synthase [Haliea sp. SAOS-164]